MDIVKMLRSYASREDISAMDKSLMIEAADRLEKYQAAEEKRKELSPALKDDKVIVYGAMKAIEDDAQCGMNMQDTIIHTICMAILDIIDNIEGGKK